MTKLSTCNLYVLMYNIIFINNTKYILKTKLIQIFVEVGL